METDYCGGVEAEGLLGGVIPTRFDFKETNYRAQGENRWGYEEYDSLFNKGIRISDDELILIFYLVPDCISAISQIPQFQFSAWT